MLPIYPGKQLGYVAHSVTIAQPCYLLHEKRSPQICFCVRHVLLIINVKWMSRMFSRVFNMKEMKLIGRKYFTDSRPRLPAFGVEGGRHVSKRHAYPINLYKQRYRLFWLFLEHNWCLDCRIYIHADNWLTDWSCIFNPLRLRGKAYRLAAVGSQQKIPSGSVPAF